MRKIMALVLTGAIAIGLVGRSASPTPMSVQTEEFTMKPTKLSKKKFSNVKYVNTIVTQDAPGTHQPPKASRTVLDYSPSVQVQLQQVPDLQETRRSRRRPGARRRQAGVRSRFGRLRGHGQLRPVRVGSAVGATTIPVHVVAFNGKNKSLILYSKPTGTFQGIPATILIGKLKKSKEKAFDQALDVTIPPLGCRRDQLLRGHDPEEQVRPGPCKPKTSRSRPPPTSTVAPSRPTTTRSSAR